GPAAAIGLHDAGPAAGPRVAAGRIRCGLRQGRLVGREAGDVVARPLGAIPPHPCLPLAPWLSLEIGRGAVIEGATVGWPRPAPLELRARGIRRVRLFSGGEVRVR